MIKKAKIYSLVILLTTFFSLKASQEKYHLIAAIKAGKEEVKKLLNKIETNGNTKNSADYQDTHGNTLLMYAVYLNKIDIVKLLVFQKAANINIKNNKGITALSIALNSSEKRKINMDIVNILINLPSTNPNIVKGEIGPLLLAASNIEDENKSQEVIKVLVEQRKADVNEQVFLLAENEKYDCIQLLLGFDLILAKFDANAQNKYGNTFLEDIITKRYTSFSENEVIPKIVDLLFKKGKIDLKGENGKNLVMEAVDNNKQAILESLINTNQISWNDFDQKEVNILFIFLAQNTLTSLIQKLLDHIPYLKQQFNINATSQVNSEITFLSALLELSNLDDNHDQKVIDLLNFLDTKNLMKLKGVDGRNAMLVAAQYNRSVILQFLYKKKIASTTWNKKYINQLLRYLANNRDIDLIKKLLNNNTFKDNFSISMVSQDEYKDTFLSSLIKTSSTNFSEKEEKIIEILDFLRDQNFMILKQEEGKKAMLLAAQNGRGLVMNWLYPQITISNNWNSHEINELFRYLARNNQFELIRKLLKEDIFKNNFDIKSTSQNKEQDTFLSALMKAPIINHLKDQNSKYRILTLLNTEKLIDFKKEEGVKTMLIAAKYNNDVIVDLLYHNPEITFNNWKKSEVNDFFRYLAKYEQNKLIESFLNENILKTKFDLSTDNHSKDFLTALMTSNFSFWRENGQEIKNKIIDILNLLSNKGLMKLDKKQIKKIILIAAQHNQQEFIKDWLLDESKTSLEDWEKNEINQLFIRLAKNEMIHTINELISSNKKIKPLLDITSEDENGKTLLHYLFFSQENDIENILSTLTLLVKEKSSFTLKEKNKIFLLACSAGHQDLVEYALKKGVNPVDTKNEKNQTGIMLASLYGHHHIIEILGNLNIEDEDKNGMTIAMLAALLQTWSTLKLLIHTYNININYQTQEKNTSLLMFIASRQERDKKDLWPSDYTSYTSTYTEEEDLKMIKYLVAHGANTKLLNKDNKTAYQLAKEANNTIIAEYLENIPTNTPLDNKESKKKKTNQNTIIKENNRPNQIDSENITLNNVNEQSNTQKLNEDQASNNEKQERGQDNTQPVTQDEKESINLSDVDDGNKQQEINRNQKQKNNTDPLNNQKQNIQFAIIVILTLATVPTVIGALYWYLVKHSKKKLTNKKGESDS